MVSWLLESVGDLGAGWLLAIAFLLPFGETVAMLDFIVPGEVGMIVVGAAAADAGRSVLPIIAIGSLGAFAGDSTSWYIGRRWGTSLVDRWPSVAVRVRPMLNRAEAYFAARGGVSILGGRFVGALRAVVPLIAGAAGMPYRRFAPWNLAASVTWVSLIVLLGAWFGSPIASFVDRWGILITLAVITGGALWFGARHLRSRRKDQALSISPERNSTP